MRASLKQLHNQTFLCLLLFLAWFQGSPAYSQSQAPVFLLPAGFVISNVVSGLDYPTAMDIAPDGSIFICEQRGNVRIVKDGVLLPEPFASVSAAVEENYEGGLVGLTLDPGFQTNHFVYLYHGIDTDTNHIYRDRIDRYTANGDVAATNPPLEILDLDPIGYGAQHQGGGMHFGKDGKLYVGVGDAGNSDNAQTLSNRLGKILRLNPDGTIPTNNPFYASVAGANRAIWALGLRNPFSFAVNKNSGRMFINDPGSDQTEEINLGLAGGNYGWPYFEGPGDTNYINPFFSYGHGLTVRGISNPLEEDGDRRGGAIVGATFYTPVTNQFPTNYVGGYFFGDYTAGWIRFVKTNSSSTVQSFAQGFNSVVDIRTAPDGSLYCLDHVGTLYQIRYDGNTNHTAPIFTGNYSSVDQFYGGASMIKAKVIGTLPITYQWYQNNQPIPDATDASFKIYYAMEEHIGDYTLVASNQFGTATSSTRSFYVYDVPIGIKLTSQTVAAGSTVTFTPVLQRDIPGLSYNWSSSNGTLSTSQSLVLTNVKQADTGIYHLMAWENYPASFHRKYLGLQSVYLLVKEAPTLLQHPKGAMALTGESWTFSASAQGSPPLRYQWRFNGTALPGKTDSTLSLVNLKPAASGNYNVLVQNRYGSAVSSNALLRVRTGVSMKLGPQNLVVNSNATALFRVVATGPALKYQWSKGDYALASQTNASLLIPHASQTDAAVYTIVVSNEVSSATGSASLVVTNSPLDVDGDGHTDLLLRHKTTGDFSAWKMNGTSLVKNVLVGYPIIPTWRFVGLNDFDGDGKKDMLLQNTNGVLSVVPMAGTNFSTSFALDVGNAMAGWSIDGIGDFNQDGQGDLLGRDTNGAVAIWLLSGTNILSPTQILINSSNMPPEWRVVGITPFALESRVNILWQKTDGRMVAWLMYQTNYWTSALMLDGKPAPGDLTSIASFNTDGGLKAIFESKTGVLSWRHLSDTYLYGGGVLRDGVPINPAWMVIGPK